MSSPTGMVGITLAGVHLTLASQAPVEKLREVKSVLEGGPGGTREHLAWQPAGYPIRTFKRRWVFTWTHVRGLYDRIEEILVGAAPYELAFWKMTHHQFVCDGVRSEFFLPHTRGVATDWLTTQPNGRPVSEHFPVVKVGLAEAGALTYSKVDSATYAGTPGAGTVYFLNQGARFKLAAAPDAGAVVVVRYVPLYLVLRAGAADKRYDGPIREPLALELVEV